MEEFKKDCLIECFPLFRDEHFNFSGVDEENGKTVLGFYNRQKINPNEPDLKLYYWSAEHAKSDEPFLSLWCKVSDRTGRKYLIGNKNGVCYIGLLNLNRLDESEPYLTIYIVLKENN